MKTIVSGCNYVHGLWRESKVADELRYERETPLFNDSESGLKRALSKADA